MAHPQRSNDCRPGFARFPRLLAAVPLLLVFSSTLFAQAPAKTTPEDQRVLVLIMSGMGPADQVSISYTAGVPAQQVKKDLTELYASSGWTIQNPTTTTEAPKVPGGKPSTSVLFSVPGLTSATSGILPIEPFVNALKRFKTIEIVYLRPPEMRYRGLKDFENEFVKVNLNRTNSTYKFVVAVKDSGFDKLNLPKLQPGKKPAARETASGPRLLLVIGVALVGFALVFLIALRVMRGRS